MVGMDATTPLARRLRTSGSCADCGNYSEHRVSRGEQKQSEQSNPRWYIALDFAEILLQSFVASYLILLVLGIIDLSSSPNTVVRLGLIEVVPLGFGAALANRLFGGSGGENSNKESQFPKNIGLFTIGAMFTTSAIAPTQEMELIAVHMDWIRHFLLIALTLVLIYLIMFELEFRGQKARVQRSWRLQVGTVFVVYAVGAAVSFLLLMRFGHFINGTVALVFQETTVLAFPASLGAAAAEVVI